MSIDRALGEEKQPDSGAGEHRFHLSRAINVALQAFARQHAFTLNTLVQAAWSLLSNCYTGERDVASEPLYPVVRRSWWALNQWLACSLILYQPELIRLRINIFYRG